MLIFNLPSLIRSLVTSLLRQDNMKYQEKVYNVLKLTKPVRNEIRTWTRVWLILKSHPLHERTLLSKGVRDLFQQEPSIQMCSTLESVPDKYHQTLKIWVTSLSLLWPPHRILPLVPNVSLLLQESYPKLWLSPLALDWKGSWQGREWLQQRGPLSSNMNANCHLFQWSKYSQEIKKIKNKKNPSWKMSEVFWPKSQRHGYF